MLRSSDFSSAVSLDCNEAEYSSSNGNGDSPATLLKSDGAPIVILGLAVGVVCEDENGDLDFLSFLLALFIEKLLLREFDVLVISFLVVPFSFSFSMPVPVPVSFSDNGASKGDFGSFPRYYGRFVRSRT